MKEEQNKFNTCQFRSADKEIRMTALCCGQRIQEEGYSCTLLSIFDIDESLCKECKYYQPIPGILENE